MRLAVLDGTVGEQEVRTIVAALNEGERAEIVGRAVIEGAEQVLATLAKGSKFTKAPRDLLTRSALRTRRRARREVEGD
jgi:adenine-specific DNA-methyltransferase